MAGFVVGSHYPTVLNRHVFESLAFHARIALHVRVLHGRDPHHITEAQFKAVARALRAAVEPDDAGHRRSRRPRACCEPGSGQTLRIGRRRRPCSSGRHFRSRRD